MACVVQLMNTLFDVLMSYLKYIDILVDGPFDCDVRKNDIDNETTVNWRGSSNQRVIVVKDTLKEDYVVCRD